MLSSKPNPLTQPPLDLLRTRWIGKFFRRSASRTWLQTGILLIAVVMILHGFLGPRLAPKNLATSLTWIYFRGVLIISLLCLGNLFCLCCPLMLVRDFARKFVHPRFDWPRALRNKWLATGLFALILFGYELFSWWSSPLWTAWLITGYFAAAVGVDIFFKRASFCKFVCPVGQFNFVASLIAPLEVAVRSREVCRSCTTKDCIRGKRSAQNELVVLQRGCELALYQPYKSGNMDCTFCLDCVHACPHDNVGILTRAPAVELMQEPRRSGIGYFSRRTDLAALVVVFVFGGLWNAFGMITPVYALERWLADLLHVTARAPIVGLLFFAFVVAAPLLLFMTAVKLSPCSTREFRRPTLQLATRYAYSLAPLGAGIWLAHYGFHFLTALLTIVPVTQSALADLGLPILGEPLWALTGLPKSSIPPLQIGFLLLGLLGSLLVAHRIAEEYEPRDVIGAAAPWMILCVALCGLALWVILQPMDMRGTFLAG